MQRARTDCCGAVVGVGVGWCVGVAVGVTPVVGVAPVVGVVAGVLTVVVAVPGFVAVLPLFNCTPTIMPPTISTSATSTPNITSRGFVLRGGGLVLNVLYGVIGWA